MAVVISGTNNSDKITATDGLIDLLSSVNFASEVTVPSFKVGSDIQIGNAGIITATTLVGNVQGNINHTSNLLLQISGSEKFRVGTSGQLGIGGANYGTSGQVLTSGGSSSAATWSTISGTTINNQSDNRMITCTGTSDTLNAEQYLTYTSQSSLNLTDGVGTSHLGGNYLNLKRSTGNTNYIVAPLADAELVISADEDIIFRTVHTADFNSTERVRIDSSGNLMVNRSSSAKRFSVKETSTSSGVYYNAHIGGASHLSNYAVGIGFDPEGYSARTKIGIVAEGISAGYSRGKLHFLLDNANDSGEATLSEARMTINDSGQVTMPNQPSFGAYKSGAGYSLNNQIFPFDQTKHNIGSHYNTGNYRFTAPVAGRYLFTFYSILNSTINSGHYEIRVNNSSGNGQSVHFTTVNSHWDHVSSSHILNLNANDYVTMWSVSSVGWHGDDWALFCGELLS